MTTPDFLTLLLACAGFILGVINTFYLMRENHVRARLAITTCKSIVRHGDTVEVDKHFIQVSVINTGKLDFTITSLRFEMPDGTGNDVVDFRDAQSDRIPCHVAPRKSANFLMSAAISPHLVGALRACASTECGKRIKGGHKFLKALSRMYGAPDRESSEN